MIGPALAGMGHGTSVASIPNAGAVFGGSPPMRLSTWVRLRCGLSNGARSRGGEAPVVLRPSPAPGGTPSASRIANRVRAVRAILLHQNWYAGDAEVMAAALKGLLGDATGGEVGGHGQQH